MFLVDADTLVPHVWSECDTVSCVHDIQNMYAETVWDRTRYYLAKGVSCAAMPTGEFVTAVSESDRMLLNDCIEDKVDDEDDEDDEGDDEEDDDEEDDDEDLASTHAHLRQAILRSLPAVGRDTCWLITEQYTNQCFSEQPVGITNQGSAGIVSVLTCRATAQIRHGNRWYDEGPLDTLVLNPLTAEQYALAMGVFDSLVARGGIDADMQAFWREQDLLGEQRAWLWASNDGGNLCISCSEIDFDDLEDGGLTPSERAVLLLLCEGEEGIDA
jgi:hypothetical protein